MFIHHHISTHDRCDLSLSVYKWLRETLADECKHSSDNKEMWPWVCPEDDDSYNTHINFLLFPLCFLPAVKSELWLSCRPAALKLEFNDFNRANARWRVGSTPWPSWGPGGPQRLASLLLEWPVQSWCFISQSDLCVPSWIKSMKYVNVELSKTPWGSSFFWTEQYCMWSKHIA